MVMRTKDKSPTATRDHTTMKLRRREMLYKWDQRRIRGLGTTAPVAPGPRTPGPGRAGGSYSTAPALEVGDTVG